MIKKLLYSAVAVLMLLSLNFTALADSGIEYYDEFDDYYEFEKDYYDSVVFPEEEEDEIQWYKKLSPIPPVIGIAAGAVTVFILYKKHSSAGRSIRLRNHSYAPDTTHNTL